MKKRTTIYILSAVTILLIATGSYILLRRHSESQPAKIYSIDAVNPPVALTGNARTEFFTLHYWDNFDFQDLVYLESPEMMQEGFQSFIVNFRLVDEPISKKAIEELLSKASTESTGDMLFYFLGLFDKWLYNPNSPFRNEELYITVLENVFALDKLDSLHLLRAERQYERLLWNRRGEKAADLPMIYSTGKGGNLYDIKTDYTLLFFYNPDCNSCGRDMAMTKGHNKIKRLSDQRKLTVIAYYPDEDMNIWEQETSKIPEGWKMARKPDGIETDSIKWDIRAIPSIYLLDKNKTVLLKDADYDILSSWLQDNSL